MKTLKIILLTTTLAVMALAGEPNFEGATLYEMFGISPDASAEEVNAAVEQGLFAARPGANNYIEAAHYGVLRWGATLLSTPQGRADYADYLSVDAQARSQGQAAPTLVQQKMFFAAMAENTPTPNAPRFGAEFIGSQYAAAPPYGLRATPLPATSGVGVRCAQLLKVLAVGAVGALATKAGEHLWKEGVKPQVERVIPSAPAAPSSKMEPPPMVGLPAPLPPPAAAPPPVVERPVVAEKPPTPMSPEEAARLRGQRFGKRP